MVEPIIFQIKSKIREIDVHSNLKHAGKQIILLKPQNTEFQIFSIKLDI